jgi:hypothetical protein
MGQEAGAPAADKPNTAISALKATSHPKQSAPGKTGRDLLLRTCTLSYVEYLNSGIAFSSSLVALNTA